MSWKKTSQILSFLSEKCKLDLKVSDYFHCWEQRKGTSKAFICSVPIVQCSVFQWRTQNKRPETSQEKRNYKKKKKLRRHRGDSISGFILVLTGAIRTRQKLVKYNMSNWAQLLSVWACNSLSFARLSREGACLT